MGHIINLASLDISDNVVGLASVVFVFMIPIVAILAKYQLKMAALMRDQQFGAQHQDSAAELRELRSLLAQQAFALDNLAQSQRQLAERLDQKQSVEQRLQSTL